MRKPGFIIAAIIAGFTGILSPVPAQTVAEGAKITLVVGNVEVRSGQNASWRKARVGMSVKMNWDIRSYLESAAEITFESGTVVKIGEKTVITIADLRKNKVTGETKSNMKVRTGQMWANVKKLSNANSDFDFETPTAVASIRGTRLGIEVTKQRTSIDVYEGLVVVSTQNSKKSVQVASQTRAVVESGSEEINLIEFNKITQTDSSLQSIPFDPFQDAMNSDSTVAGIDSTAQITDSLAGPVGADTSTVTDSLTAPGDSTVGPVDTLEIMEGVQPESGITDTSNIQMPVSNYATGGIPLKITLPPSGSIVKETPVMLRGITAAGASVVVAGKVIDVGQDGAFAEMVDLSPGANIIPIKASLKQKSSSINFAVEYHPELILTVSNIENNMEVSSRTLHLDITVTEGASYSVNNRTGANTVELNPGNNLIIVSALDSWNNRTQQQFQVVYRPVSGFTLNVVSPADRALIKEPNIQVTGSTVSGAKVFVNDEPIPVGPDGFFSYRVPIPDEQQDYTVEIRAEYQDNELVQVRTVTYKAEAEKVFLDLATPANGQTVNKRVIRVSGKTNPRAKVSANGMNILNNSGVFAADINLFEKDIGEYSLEIIADLDGIEVVRNVNLAIGAQSPEINTSAPLLSFQMQGQQATNRDRIPVQLMDRTPDDQLTLSITNNGSTERITTEPGRSETFILNEGINNYSLKVIDLAGNISNIISGKIYYLPGPIVLSLNEPSSNPYIVKGLPPLPRQYSTLKYMVEVEVDDGIGTVPESIRYVKVTGSSQTVLLRNGNDYRYRGEVKLNRGSNSFIVQTEDLNGNVAMMKLEMIIE